MIEEWGRKVVAQEMRRFLNAVVPVVSNVDSGQLLGAPSRVSSIGGAILLSKVASRWTAVDALKPHFYTECSNPLTLGPTRDLFFFC